MRTNFGMTVACISMIWGTDRKLFPPPPSGYLTFCGQPVHYGKGKVGMLSRCVVLLQMADQDVVRGGRGC